jgi:hypothetical protein
VLHTVPSVPAAAFLSATVKPDDYVVVLLDVFGADWAIVEHLAGSDDALSLVDEVFLVCHSGEWLPHWPTQHSTKDCHRLVHALRQRGVLAHLWFQPRATGGEEVGRPPMQ